MLTNLGLAVSVQAHCPAEPIALAFYEFGGFFSAAANASDPLAGRGIDLEVVQELQRRSGCRFRTEVMSRKRIWTELEADRLDMATSAIHTPERERRYWYVDYLRIRHQVWMLRKRVAELGGLSEATVRQDLRWGVVRGYRHTPAFDDLLAQAGSAGRLVEATDDSQLLNILAEGRVDAIIGHEVVMRRYIDAHPRQPEVLAMDWGPGSEPVPLGLVLNQHSFKPADASYWRGLIAGMQRDGSLLRIFRMFVSEDQAQRMLLPAP